jgi:hypothetical protein
VLTNYTTAPGTIHYTRVFRFRQVFSVCRSYWTGGKAIMSH